MRTLAGASLVAVLLFGACSGATDDRIATISGTPEPTLEAPGNFPENTAGNPPGDDIQESETPLTTDPPATTATTHQTVRTVPPASRSTLTTAAPSWASEGPLTGSSDQVSSNSGSTNCGGNLPPCWVLGKESGYGTNNFNEGGCGGRNCYTQWQFDPLTWEGVRQAHPELELPADPAAATFAQADSAAAALWDGGDGCGHWAAC